MWKPGAGRPSSGGRKKGRAANSGAAKLRADFTALQKHAFCLQMADAFKQSGHSRHTVFAQFAKELRCLPATVRKMWDYREIWNNKAELTARGVKLGLAGKAWGKPAKGSGSRLQEPARKRQPVEEGGRLGTTDHLLAERLAVGAWARQQEEHGHVLGRQDLFRQLAHLTALKQQRLQAQKAAAGFLPEQDEKALFAWADCIIG